MTARLEPLSVRDLVYGGPLAGASLVTGVGLDRPVHQVRLVESRDEVRACPPFTAVVLHRAAAQSGWAMESAMLEAWEAAASCVVAPVANLRTRSIEALSRRLGVELIGVDGNMSGHALAVAAAVANPDAARAGIVARCALKLAEVGPSPRSLVGTLNHELPGVRVALLAPDGTVVAGRVSAAVPDGDHAVHVEVPGPDGTVLATLVAVLARWSPAWAETVRSVLRIAAPPLVTSIVTRQVRLTRTAEHARTLFEAILDVPTPPAVDGTEGDGAADALALGWRLHGRHIAVVVVPALPRPDADLDQLTAGLLAAWPARRPLVRYRAGWATWWTGGTRSTGAAGGAGSAGAAGAAGRLTVRRVVADTRKLLGELHAGVALVAGVGEPADGVPGLRDSLEQAAVAAAAARVAGHGPVAVFGTLGPRGVLASVSREALAGPARTALAPVLAADDGLTLIETMVAVLDAGGSSGRAAARLGVHRNTVIARLDKLRQLGVDLTDPDTRLALHLAGYALITLPGQR